MQVSIQIGNSDDKLSQRQWSNYVSDMAEAISHYSKDIHFSGGAEGWRPWQNYCWIIELPDHSLMSGFIGDLVNEIIDCRKRYNQESVALSWGKTLFV